MEGLVDIYMPGAVVLLLLPASVDLLHAAEPVRFAASMQILPVHTSSTWDPDVCYAGSEEIPLLLLSVHTPSTTPRLPDVSFPPTIVTFRYQCH